MSNKMKMSEVFDLPVHIGEKAASHASAISDRSGTFGIINDSAAVQVSTAINNHDRLVEENAELRANCEKSNTWCIDIFNDFSESEAQTMPPSIIGAWNRGKQLLNK